jgi:predicted dehydrogenase
MSQPAVTTDSRLRAAVIGLGQAGSRFDEEPGRRVAWSHVGAYLALAHRVGIAGAVEIAPANVAAFRARCPDVPVHADVGRLIAECRPQLASICTPADSHGDVLFQLLECDELRLIWCEKPLSSRFDEARRMVEACRARGVKLMVSYNRHWLPVWRTAQTRIRDGVIGVMRSARVAFPNRLFSIGSHAVDLALMLGGRVETVVALRLPGLEETGEPAVGAFLRYESGAAGIVQVTGLSRQLIVEAEVIGDDGRLFAREDHGTITIEQFEPSRTYTGYRQLGASRVEQTNDAAFSAFVAMAENAVDAVTRDASLACDGAHALEVQRVLELMAAAPR